jgi:two-component system phosphate regulon response regulator PhoB
MKGSMVLVVEDDVAVLRLTSDLLRGEGCRVMGAATLEEGWSLASKHLPALVVLDWQFPKGSGLDLCKKLKASPITKAAGVFMLTARGASNDIVEGLKAGADDYMPKPFHEQEFLARVEALLRRFQPATRPAKVELESGALRLSRSSRKAWNGEEELRLTLREFELLSVLMQRPGEALSRDELIQAAWGPGTAIVAKAVDVHITHLRAKLTSEAARIKSVPQVGYRLDA